MTEKREEETQMEGKKGRGDKDFDAFGKAYPLKDIEEPSKRKTGRAGGCPGELPLA